VASHHPFHRTSSAQQHYYYFTTALLTMMKKSTVNPLLQLLSSLQKQTDSDPYLILVENSLSFSQRQTAASTEKDLAVYQRAQVKTPSQRAYRDSCGNLWISEMCQQCTTKLVWVETTGTTGIRRPSLRTLQSSQVVCLPAGTDPLGWDNSEDNIAVEKTSLATLDSLAKNILKEATPNSMIVLESLTPLVTLHGLERTVNFLRHLLQHSSSTTIVVPVLIECMTPSQHVVLEDLAQAVLILEGGEATLMRRGVRERSNLLRDQVHFEINDDGLRLLSTDTAPTTPNTSTETTTSIISAETVVEKEEPAVVSSKRRPGKVTLRHEEEGDVTATPEPPAPKPNIYLQDDDPEFDDMDEEDPDDDLDI